MSSLRPSGLTILLGWDAADWEVARPLMDAGRMPCLASLVRRGAAGSIESYAPYLSPMLWATVATGHWPDRHGIHGFVEIDRESGRAGPITSATRQTKALWNILSGQGLTCGVVGWLGSHPAEAVHGAFVSDAFARAPRQEQETWPVPPGAVYPPARAAALGELRARPGDLDAGLLGLFLPELAQMDVRSDARPAQLLAHLAELYTLHNATMAILADDRPTFLTMYTHFLDWVSHHFMRFHPPKMEDTSAQDHRFYQGVVTGAYRLLDLLLADLLRQAGPQANVIVVSDHGFASGARRPRQTPKVTAGIAAWHRPQGVFAAAGPGVRAGTAPLGAVLADVAPTVLALFGLPVGADLPGRVLSEILTHPPAPESVVPSWENVPDRVAPPPASAAHPEGDKLLLRQFAELGYLDPAVERVPAAAAMAARQNAWNLGVALFELGQAEAALPHLETSHFAEPESPQFAFHLARCQMQLGLIEEAELSARTLFDFGATQSRAVLLRAQLSLARRQPEKALALLQRIQDQPETSAECASFTRTALLQLRHFPAAARAFEQDLQHHPHHYLSWLGLANARFCQGDFTGAIDAARRALSLQSRLPAAYAILVQALEKSGLAADVPAVFGQLRQVYPKITAGQEVLFLAPAAETLLDRRLETLSNKTGRTLQLREQAAVRRLAFIEAKAASRAGQEPLRFAQAQPRARSASDAPSQDDFYLIVSGAPRSGTSLMMRMLAFGGVPILTDGAREPDDDNPLGYFEWEDAKRLPAQPQLITAAAGQAVKIVSPLLRHLPNDRIYHVIFMRRDPEEIALSQTTMLARGGKTSALPPAALAAQLEAHLAETLAWLRSASHIRLLEIPFAALLENPSAESARLLNFIGSNRLPRPQSLARAVQPDLWRHRHPAAVSTLHA